MKESTGDKNYQGWRQSVNDVKSMIVIEKMTNNEVTQLITFDYLFLFLNDIIATLAPPIINCQKYFRVNLSHLHLSNDKNSKFPKMRKLQT